MTWQDVVALRKKAKDRGWALAAVVVDDSGTLDLALLDLLPDGGRGRFGKRLALGEGPVCALLEEQNE